MRLETKACEKSSQTTQNGTIFVSLFYFLSLFKIAFHLVCLILSFLQYIIYLQAARETGALKAAKDQLEKRVEDLTLRVALEKRSRVIIFPLVFLRCTMS